MIPIKPKTISRLTRLVKSLHPQLQRLPAPLPRPGSEAYPAPREFTAAEAGTRQHQYLEADQYRPDKETARFWATPFIYEGRR